MLACFLCHNASSQASSVVWPETDYSAALPRVPYLPAFLPLTEPSSQEQELPNL